MALIVVLAKIAVVQSTHTRTTKVVSFLGTRTLNLLWALGNLKHILTLLSVAWLSLILPISKDIRKKNIRTILDKSSSQLLRTINCIKLMF